MQQCPENLDDNHCDTGDGGEDVVAESNSNSQEADELRDTDSDFGYREYASTDSEEEKEDEVTFREKLASWATKSGCGRSQIDDLLGILKDEGLDVPRDSRTLLKTPRQIQTQDNCGGQYIYFGIKHSVVKIMARTASFWKVQTLWTYQ